MTESRPNTRLTAAEAVKAIASGAALIDVRSVLGRRRDGELQGAVIVAKSEILDVLTRRLHRAKENAPVLVFCSSVKGSGPVIEALLLAGHRNVFDVDGGFAALRGEGVPLAVPGIGEASVAPAVGSAPGPDKTVGKAEKRQLHIASFLWAGATSQSWRHPSVRPDSGFDIDYYIQYGKLAEEGLIDALFLADSANFPAGPDAVVERMASVSLFEPATLMTAIAAHTSRIGLIYTASSSDNEPSALARQVASLDHISHGRAGWNLVTSYGPGSRHLGLPPDERETRYDRANEFYEVVTGLWDSFEDDAFRYDQDSGVYFDTNKLHRLNHQGRYYTTPGPLKIARPVQGHPVIAQAGASEAGLNLGARTADVIFSNNLSLEYAQTFYKDIKSRAVAFGRDPDDVKVLTGCGVVWGETDEIANQKLDEISNLFSVELAVANLSIGLEKYDPDQPFPRDLPPAAFSLGHQKAITDFAIANNLTIRQTALRLAAANKHRSIAGTAKTIADNFQEWLEADACDGIVLMTPFLLDGLRDFVRHVVPELQRRGLFRTAYEGKTLRENLGLKRPQNRHVNVRKAAE